jgi:TonB family protein
MKGSLDKEIIRRVIRTHLNELRYCYQRELPAKPGLYGRLVVNFTITPTGQVMLPKIDQTTLNNLNVEQCVVQATRRWTFPRPENGIVVVSYPFVFHSPDADR